MNFSKNALWVCAQLENAGHPAYIVGGAVRDTFMGREPKDIDIVTDCCGMVVKKIFDGYTALDMGAAFGITTVIFNGEPFEIAQMRIDGDYSDGRRPDVIQPVREIEKDLYRRDFTMNAIAFRPSTGAVLDPTCGVLDIQDRIIEFVGNPAERIQEDHLRILRAFRFMSQLDFVIGDNSLDAIKAWFESGKGLDGVSQERITAEFIKIVSGKNAFNTVKLMTEIGVLQIIVPEFGDQFIDHNNNWHNEEMEPFGKQIITHTLMVFKAMCEMSKIPEARLAALFHDIAKPKCRGTKSNGESNYIGHDRVGFDMVNMIFNRMKFCNATTDAVANLVKRHMDIHNLPKTKKVYKVRRLMGRGDFPMLLNLGIADSMGSIGPNGKSCNDDAIELITAVEKYKEMFPEMLPPAIVTGNDLIEAGLKPGPKFSDALYRTHSFQLNGCVDKAKLIRYAIGIHNNG